VNPNDTLSKNCSLINVKNDESSLSSEKCKGCICEIVLKHPDTLRGYPFLTYGGSFWTNDLFKTVSEYGDVFKKIGMEEFDLNGKYNSIALIPLRSQDKMIGAMLICSESKDTFKEETIRFFERISVSIGITIANKEIKEKLEENERILSKSQKIAKIGSWVNKTGSKLYYLSDEGMSILGTENRVITIDDLLAVTHPDDRNKMNEKRAAGRETMSPYSYDVRFVDQKGELRYINVSAEPVYSDGVCVEFNGILQDITERTKVLLELEENKLFLDSILTGIQAAIVIADPEQKIVVYANSTAKKLLKADDDSLTGKSYDNFISGAEEQEETHSDYIITLQDNTLIPVVRSVLHVKWKGKLHYAIIFFDLTDRKILERQLAIAQKMESIGQLAAGIAHEINTPVQYIGDNTHFIKDVMEQFLDFYTAFEKLKILAEEEGVGEKTFELLKNMEKLIEIDFVKEEVPLAIDQTLEGVERVSTIVRAMKMFSHPGSDEQTIIDINTSVKNTVTVARNEWKYVADIVMDLDETNPKILGQPVDFNQVLLNLLVNAAHAIEDVNKGTDKKGTITITTSTEKDNAVVKIKDTGSGIPANIANKIFDPFFTTKEVGKGTGQGLSICHTVIRDKYGGQIYFDTVEKEGTTFIIKLKKIDT
jgi:PAS domain S-box-containing protein